MKEAALALYSDALDADIEACGDCLEAEPALCRAHEIETQKFCRALEDAAAEREAQDDMLRSLEGLLRETE